MSKQVFVLGTAKSKKTDSTGFRSPKPTIKVAAVVTAVEAKGLQIRWWKMLAWNKMLVVTQDN